MEALTNPIGSPPLAHLASGKTNAVILISDMTRLCPSYEFLGPLLDELNRGGLPDFCIRIVIALGMHRKQTPDEIRQLVGGEVLERVQVINHSPLPDDCVHLGVTSHGTPIEINRFVAEADLLVATGNIEPHRLVGMSGGVKALVPGVASQRCIEHNHSLSQRYQVLPGDVNNPVHRDLEEALRRVPIHFLFNVIVNHDRSVIGAVAGHIVEAHRAGVDLAKRIFLVPVAKSYDAVIASTGGYPKDMQLYQAVKTLQNASAIVKPGGAVVLIARCEELFGNGIFQYWVETIQNPAKIAAMLQERFVLGAHKAGHLHKILQRHTVYLYSDLPEATAGLAGFTPVQDLDETVKTLVNNGLADIGVMPYGAITFPVTEMQTLKED